jgi:putative ABC transport system permease protein
MRRAPGVSLVAVLTLALAIGANTAIFSVVDALLIRPLAYRESERLVAIDATRSYEGAPRPSPVSWQLDEADRWRESLRVFYGVTFYTSQVFQLTSRDGSELLDGATVAPSFFSTLGGPMAAGRPIAPADASAPAIVISHRLARRLFKDSPAALGAHLVLNSRDYVVIGVAGTHWDLPSWKTDVWEPSGFAQLRNPQCCSVQLLGRLRSDATIGQARADVDAAARTLAAADSKTFGRLHTTVAPLRDKQLGDGRQALLLLWAAVGIVLAMACANIVSLLIARNVARGREMAIRQALGASRGRLVLQGLTESAVLAAGGVAGGLLIARVAAGALVRIDPGTFPRLQTVRIDLVALSFASALGIFTTLATGILPSIEAANAPPPRTLTSAPTRRHRRLQQWLCVTQIAAAVVLLAAAALLARSLADLLTTDLGVTTEQVVTASINTAFGRPHSAEEIAQTMLQVVDRVRQIPGVRAAGAGTSLPPDTSRIRMSLKRKNDEIDYVASAVLCTPGYFEALGIRLVKGRFFTGADDPQHLPVIIVSGTTARHLFGTDDPLGQTFSLPRFQYRLGTARQATVVGIVSDVKYSGIDAQAGDQVYFPLAQAPWLSTFLAVRTAGDVSVGSELRRVVSSVDPTVAISSIRPLDDIIADSTAPARFRTSLIAAFAVMGLAIATIGLYGVVAYSVSQRTAEIGVRVALGASQRDVMSLVLREGLVIAAAGAAIGLPMAFATSRTFASLLFGVRPTDPLTYLVSAGVAIAVALAATYAPARRAAQVDPIVALRAE